jgi:hypothetical protein
VTSGVLCYLYLMCSYVTCEPATNVICDYIIFNPPIFVLVYISHLRCIMFLHVIESNATYVYSSFHHMRHLPMTRCRGFGRWSHLMGLANVVSRFASYAACAHYYMWRYRSLVTFDGVRKCGIHIQYQM